MAFLETLLRLPGPSAHLTQLPHTCPTCACKEFYKQSDFRRSLGVTLVSIASLSTFVLMYMGYNWFLVWSPMLAFLIFDRAFFYLRPLVLICYNCDTRFRGLTKEQLQNIEGFDLEVHDRYRYKHEHQTETECQTANSKPQTPN